MPTVLLSSVSATANAVLLRETEALGTVMDALVEAAKRADPAPFSAPSARDEASRPR